MENYQIIKAVFKKNMAISYRYKIDTISLIFRPLLTIIPYVILGKYIFSKSGYNDTVINIANYKVYIVISLIVLNLTISGVYSAMNLLENEIQRGNIENILSANISVNKYFFAELMYRYLEQIIISTLMLLVCLFAFKINFHIVHKLVFLVILICSGLISFGLGFILTGLTMKTKMTKLAYMILSVFIFLSGQLYPITIFPKFLKILAYINPLTYIIDLTRYAVLDIETYFNKNIELLLCIVLGLIILFVGNKMFKLIIIKLKKNGSLTNY